MLLGFAEIGSCILSLQAADQQPVLCFDDPFISLQLWGGTKQIEIREFHQQKQTMCQCNTEVEKMLGWHTTWSAPQTPAHSGACAFQDTLQILITLKCNKLDCILQGRVAIYFHKSHSFLN